MIYEPSEDSYFFEEFLKKYIKENNPKSYLDMGTGSGILGETASKLMDKSKITTSDVNPDSVRLLKKKGFNAKKSDLFEKINNNFDLITFNTPYLPLDEREPIDSRLATTGGIKGDEISVEFLKQAKNHLNNNGKILLLISSLTPIYNINKFNPKILAEKKISQETLKILEFS